MAIAFGYIPATNIITVTGGTAGTPATFADFVVADRAGTYTIMDAIATALNLVLDRLIRPVELRALQITFTLAGTNAGAGDTVDITGTDAWGNAQNESINVAAGNGAYTSAKYWRTITDIDCTGFADGVGTIDAVQGQWGVIWDYDFAGDLGGGAYRLDCNFNIGDGGVSTYFISLQEIIIISKGFGIVPTANATLKTGEKISSDTGTLGSVWHWQQTSADVFNYFTGSKGLVGAGTVLSYGSTWKCTCSASDGNSKNLFISLSNDNNEFIDTIFMGLARLRFDGIPEITNCKIFTTKLGLLLEGAATINSFDVKSSIGGFSPSSGGCSASNIEMYDITTNGLDIYNIWADQKLIDCIFDGAIRGPTGGGADKACYKQYTCNIHIADKDGVDLAGVVVDCEDRLGNPVWAAGTVTTNAGGDIAEQIISYWKTWFLAGVQTDTLSPHVFTISKAGYETQVLDEITVDHPIVWHEELQNSGSQRPRFRMHGA